MTDASRADSQVDGPGSPTNFGALQERVRNIDVRLAELATSLRETNMAVREATQAMAGLGKPRWSVWIGGGTLICIVTGAMWGLAISPIIDRVKVLEAMSLTIVPREVHIEKWAQIKEDMQRIENEISQRASKDDLNRVIIEIDRKLSKR